MTYEEAMHFWFGRVNFEVKSPWPSDLHLHRIRALLEALRNPQERFRIVHVAGSKGKGSTSAMLDSVLREAGYRTGLFTSPHLVNVEERIQVDRKPISRDELACLMADIHRACRPLPAGVADPLGIHPLAETLTFFEIATALGFLHFARRRVDVAVVEVGMGGRFDSTNVSRPLLSIITSISLDHTQQLGSTLDRIAMEKAGIIKPGRPVVSGVRGEEARHTIQEIAKQRNAPLVCVDEDYRYRRTPACIAESADRPERVQVTTRHCQWPWMDVALMGEHQAANAALAIAAVESLRKEGLAISDQAVAAGLRKVHWPARLEIVGRRPLIVIDCAHNVASAEALAEALTTSFPLASPKAKRHLVFAGSRDKDLAGMLKALTPLFDRVYLTRFGKSPRAVPPESLASHVVSVNPPSFHADAAEALASARSAAAADDLVCITGSVFLAGELRPLLVG